MVGGSSARCRDGAARPAPGLFENPKNPLLEPKVHSKLSSSLPPGRVLRAPAFTTDPYFS